MTHILLQDVSVRYQDVIYMYLENRETDLPNFHGTLRTEQTGLPWPQGTKYKHSITGRYTTLVGFELPQRPHRPQF